MRERKFTFCKDFMSKLTFQSSNYSHLPGFQKTKADLTHDSEIIVMELYYKHVSVLFDIYVK